jgi:hypothetical protein
MYVPEGLLSSASPKSAEAKPDPYPCVNEKLGNSLFAILIENQKGKSLV